MASSAPVSPPSSAVASSTVAFVAGPAPLAEDELDEGELDEGELVDGGGEQDADEDGLPGDLPSYAKRTNPTTGYGAKQARAGQPARPGGKGRKRAGESRHSPRRIEAVQRQFDALEYRKAGLSYSAIAAKMGLAGPQTAWNMVESGLQRTLQEPADQVRKLEVERLDALFMVAYNKTLMQKDMQASNQALSIMNRRARLLGLDAPVVSKSEITTGAQGMLVIPPVMEPAAWDALVQAQQAEALVDRAALRGDQEGDQEGEQKGGGADVGSGSTPGTPAGGLR